MKGTLLSCERMPKFCASELSSRLKAVGAAASRSVWAAKPLVADSNAEENLSGLYKSAGISCDRAPMVARSSRAALLHLLHWRAPFSLASVNPSCVGSIHLQTLYCPIERASPICLHTSCLAATSCAKYESSWRSTTVMPGPPFDTGRNAMSHVPSMLGPVAREYDIRRLDQPLRRQNY